MISWPAQNIADTIDAIRDAIGRDITIYVNVVGDGCPACDLDPITNLSVDPFCLTCSGLYWINTLSAYVTTAHVTQLGVDTPIMTVGGNIIAGDTRLQIKYTVSALDAVRNAHSYYVDGRKFLAKKVDERGAPTPNRIVITLEEVEGV